MNVKLGVVMDPITSITFSKDSTISMLLQAQARGWELWYMEQGDLVLRDVHPMARMQRLTVQDDPTCWFSFGDERFSRLDQLHVILMRKDPPFNMEYIFTTYILEQAERAGVVVVNQPRALRDANEKLFTLQFPQCTPPTLVTSRLSRLREFLHEQGACVIKPLDGMGGEGVFRLHEGDPNTNVVLETATRREQRHVMAQLYLPELLTSGDKRILLIDGDPVPHALARFPAEDDSRGNLASGGRGTAVPLSRRDLWICEQVSPVLREKGLLFAGLDVIGDFLTEINVTSPTCIRELDQLCGLDISKLLLDRIEARLI